MTRPSPEKIEQIRGYKVNDLDPISWAATCDQLLTEIDALNADLKAAVTDLYHTKIAELKTRSENQRLEEALKHQGELVQSLSKTLDSTTPCSHAIERDRLKEILLEVLNQACGQYGPSMSTGDYRTADHTFKGYDSMCLSSYEAGLDLLVELGVIQKEEVIR